MIHNDLIKIKNAYLAKQAEVILPYSKLAQAIVDVLAKKGYVGKPEVITKGARPVLSVPLLYAGGVPHLHEVHLLSKPGRRIYAGVSGIHNVRQGFGDLIVSTSQGVMTARQAKRKGLGGEVICEVF